MVICVLFYAHFTFLPSCKSDATPAQNLYQAFFLFKDSQSDDKEKNAKCACR